MAAVNAAAMSHICNRRRVRERPMNVPVGMN
jgi:hypothetical protein